MCVAGPLIRAGTKYINAMSEPVLGTQHKELRVRFTIADYKYDYFSFLRHLRRLFVFFFVFPKSNLKLLTH